MENKNLVITAAVLLVLLVSMYGVRFGLMNEKASSAEAKEVVQGNVIDNAINDLKDLNGEEETEEQPEEPVEEEVAVVEPEVVVENVASPVNNQNKKSNVQQHNSHSRVEQTQYNNPVIEQPRVEEQPAVEIPVETPVEIPVETPVETPVEVPVEEPKPEVIETPQEPQPQVEVPLQEDHNPTEDIIIEDN